jgi:hypothetical protein
MEIIKYQSTTSREAQIIRASQDVKIAEHLANNQKTLKATVSAILLKANANIGGKKILADNADFQIMLNNTLELIAEKWKYITLGELSNAVLYGSIGEYKKEQETLYLSVANINGWIKAYIDTTKTPVMRKFVNQYEESKPKEVSPEELELIMQRGLKEKIKQFNETGDCDDFGNVCYNYLDKKGLIKFTAEQKKEFMKQAENQIRQENNWKTEQNFSRKNEIMKYLELLEKGQKIDEVVILAKKIALKEYIKTV